MAVSRHGWARALDIQMDTLAWHIQDYGEAMLQGFYESFFKANPDLVKGDEAVDIIAAKQMAMHTAIALHRADTIYVTSDMLHILMQAAHDLPEEAVFDDHVLISKYGFVYFEEAIVGEDRHGETMCIHAISWETNPIAASESNPDPMKAIVIYFWTDPYDDRVGLNEKYGKQLREVGIPVPPLSLDHFYPAKVGDHVPKLEGLTKGQQLVIEVSKIFIAMHLLAQQRIGEPVKMRPDRATRKRMARKYNAGDRLVTLITLRRRKAAKDNHEPAKIEYTRRWLVRGHWRRQPDKHGWHWTYIYEYLKGPEDKPFIPTERRIFDFKR
jgi:hypothetical protein